MLRIGVCGAAGRMGSMIIRLIAASTDFKLAAAVEFEKHPKIGADAGEIAGCGRLGVNLEAGLEKSVSGCDVVIDFSSVEGAFSNLPVCAKAKKPLIIGTTGFKPEEKTRIAAFAKDIPVMHTANMSIGVNLLFKLVKEAARALKDKDFDTEIVETHHRFKKDAPSGTALKLAEVIAEEKGLKLEKVLISGREGFVGERPKDAIGILAVRAGDVVGDHTVTFGALGERLELTHKAHSRETFAKGALVAARFLAGKKPGMYDMQDVLSLK
ncbi:MAG: 4-hydroxy-tetrahydrodipicolinate reductase [Candidatus Firestonebacteria bacterium]